MQVRPRCRLYPRGAGTGRLVPLLLLSTCCLLIGSAPGSAASSASPGGGGSQAASPRTGAAPAQTQDDCTGQDGYCLRVVVPGPPSPSGTVTSPSGIQCPSDCAAIFSVRPIASPTLTVVPNPGAVFTGWGGDCAVAQQATTCTLTMDSDKNVSASFAPATRTLTVTVVGGGTVTGPGISCPQKCQTTYPTGSAVALTASPSAGVPFAGWSGDCQGSGVTCTLTMDGDKRVTASFTTLWKLTVVKAGGGGGSVTSAPAGLVCGPSCSASFPPGTQVTLTGAPDAGSTLTGWTGCSGQGPTCTLTMDGDKTVTATFSLVGAPQPPSPPPPSPPPPSRPTTPATTSVPEIGDPTRPEPSRVVTLATANPADDSIVAEVAAGVTDYGVVEQGATRALAQRAGGIRCGFNEYRCYTRVEPGERIELNARPLAGYVFKAWNGACSGQGPRCVIVARALQSTIAIFAPRAAAPTVGFQIRPTNIHIKWLRSVGTGRIVVSGGVGGRARLRLQLRRPGGGPLLTRQPTVTAGRFRQVIPFRKDVLPRGAIVLPGGFVVSVRGSSGTSSLPFQLRPIVVPAPLEGVVRQAFASTVEDGPPTVRLPRGATQAWAQFRLATQPSTRLRLTVAWYWPNGRLLGTVEKANRPGISSVLRLSSGLPRGRWVAELRAGAKVVKRLTVRIG